MRDAYKEKQYAFVSDYARLDIIYEHGGIYLDTDVEVLGCLDELLYDEAFAGLERGGAVNTGLGFGAVSKFALIKEFMESYNDEPFFNCDGSINLRTCTMRQSDVLMKYGLRKENMMQMIKGMRIYPKDVLSPEDRYGFPAALTENSRTSHKYSASWCTDDILEGFDVMKQYNYNFWYSLNSTTP
jgi:hypothetical protein